MPLEQVNKRIEELYNQWVSLQPLNQGNSKRLWKKIKLEWNYNSNRIEGNTLTYSETELLLFHDRTGGNHSMRDYVEMKAHDLGIKKIRKFAADKERPLTEADIRDLNLIILKEPFRKKAKTLAGELTWKEIIPGKYKTEPNHVETATGEIFKFALPEEVPAKMKELMEWFKESIESPPASIASFLAELHHRFILIHPFDDGNGRIVRLLLNYVLMRLGYPPFVIENRNRESYFSALQKADAGNMDALAAYLGRTLVSWLEIGIKAAKGEDISEPADIDKEVDIFIREKKTKGLPEVEPLSGQTEEEFCKQLLMPLFDTFENRFKKFNDLFNSIEISVQGPQRMLDHLFLLVIGEGSIFDTVIGNTVSLKILYKTYRGEKPFNMETLLSVQLHEVTYRVTIHTYLDSSPDPKVIERERIYARMLTDSEIEEFVSEGKELFFKKLKQREGEQAD